jgi:hypothetical protein
MKNDSSVNIQGRTYTNMSEFVERYITARVLETTRDHWLGDQTALDPDPVQR